jgi:hypothetical protein
MLLMGEMMRNDAFGNLLPETSLKHLMAQLSHFQDKEMPMQCNVMAGVWE